MKTTLLLLLFTTLTFANGIGVCPPVLTPDSQTVAPTCSGLGDYVYAYRGTAGQVWFNDNYLPLGSDEDFNDAVAGFSISPIGAVTFWWAEADSAWVDTISLDGQTVSAVNPAPITLPGVVPNGAILDFTITTPYDTYHAGPGSLNDDGAIHDWVVQDPGTPSPTPEPASAALIGLGLGVIGIQHKLRARKG